MANNKSVTPPGPFPRQGLVRTGRCNALLLNEGVMPALDAWCRGR